MLSPLNFWNIIHSWFFSDLSSLQSPLLGLVISWCIDVDMNSVFRTLLFRTDFRVLICSMALNIISILMTSEYLFSTLTCPLNTGSHSIAFMTSPLGYSVVLSNSTSPTHNPWFPFPTLYFHLRCLFAQMAFPLTLLHRYWTLGLSLAHSLLSFTQTSIPSKSSWSILQNRHYIQILMTTSSVTILPPTMIISYVSVTRVS